MNHILEETAREYLRTNLVKMPEGWQFVFRMMYGRKNGKRSVEDTVAMDINEVPREKLDWAMQQSENSLKKLEKVS